MGGLMQRESNSTSARSGAKAVRLRTVAVLVAFVALSAGLHFILGPAMTELSPHWAYRDLPGQALSIVTLSHKLQPESIPSPTPPPTPPPKRTLLTHRNLSLLKYQEMGLALSMRPVVRPPARRKSTIILERNEPRHLHENSRDSDVVVAVPQPTPQETPPHGAARAETAGNANELSGSIVWGDDNPPRLLKRATLAVDDNATGTARVDVEVSPAGLVMSVRLEQSSGDATVDQAALDAARNSTFAPATLNGLPVHGTCVLEFGPNAAPTT